MMKFNDIFVQTAAAAQALPSLFRSFGLRHCKSIFSVIFYLNKHVNSALFACGRGVGGHVGTTTRHFSCHRPHF